MRPLRIAIAALTIALMVTSAAAQTVSNPFGTIDTSTTASGVVPLIGANAALVHPTIAANFDKYTKYVAPNGSAIHIIGQASVTGAQMKRARDILAFYLTPVPGSTYGSAAQKALVANTMANSNATLIYTNAAGDIETLFNTTNMGDLNLEGQDLGGNESPVPGSAAWLSNSTRDASYEEIFHLVHAKGIIPALPAYQAQIQAATTNARPNRNMSPSNLWTIDSNFYDELAAEGSLTHEYIISVIDVYYGLWAHNPDGNGNSFFGEYVFDTRSDLPAGDPLGLAAVESFLPPQLTHENDIDPTFSGTFSLTHDALQPYTLKSRYFRDAALSGALNTSLIGNALDNRLSGNEGNNLLDGAAGNDTALYSGVRSEYTITVLNDVDYLIVDRLSGRDGTDTLRAVENAQFSDQVIALPEPALATEVAVLAVVALARLRRRASDRALAA